MARVRSVESTRVHLLADGWSIASAPAGRIVDPAALDSEDLDWCAATVPGTSASALRAASRWTVDDQVDFDQDDWWWRCQFSADRVDESTARSLRFNGLASLAEVWLNGRSILQSRNMFVEHDVPVDGLLRDRNDLVVCFRSVGAAVKARRPRPRWRTRLVEAQQLRWMRTTLMGRIPAWTPRAAPVGPWRGVWLEDRSFLATTSADVKSRVDGDAGVVDVSLVLDVTGGRVPQSVHLTVGGIAGSLECSTGDRPGRAVARGSVRVEGVDRWWPHTHGTPRLYPMAVTVTADGQTTSIDLGAVGFRDVELLRDAGGFAVRVNGTEVFCRGACWTTVDAVSLSGPPDAYRTTLEAVRAAGMNMIRICGPFFYEENVLYELCDELGILVWQDYAFANMDYPGDDPEFVAEVEREARGFLDRTQTSSALVVLCGNGEVEQQAAMMGAPRGLWRSPLFGETLARVSAEMRPDLPYWPSTPSGGGLPFLNDVGTAHYFGVGAYLRPLQDARCAGVRFATECLAFANVPDATVVDDVMKSGGVPPQDPRWKARTPRDSAAGWDFEDVRDHYLREVYGVDPIALRYSDIGRYLALSRVVTGEVMAATFSEWRRSGSDCKGALIWFLQDLWPGAGWGVLDARGQPKAAYFYLRRVLRPVTVLVVDEGLNGLDAHIVNDGPHEIDGELRVATFRGEAIVASATARVRGGPRSVVRVRTADLFEHFVDTTYAYRFGPCAHEVTVATLVDTSTGENLGEAFHFPRAIPSRQEADVGLEAVASPTPDGWKVTLRARRVALSVELEVRDYEPDDNYFHIAPGGTKDVALRALRGATRPQGTARPLNAQAGTKVEIRG